MHSVSQDSSATRTVNDELSQGSDPFYANADYRGCGRYNQGGGAADQSDNLENRSQNGSESQYVFSAEINVQIFK